MAGTSHWRRIVGLCFLATTVILWVASGFLASSIFADATYSKPFFVIYFNTAFFALLLIPFTARRWYLKRHGHQHSTSYAALSGTDDHEGEEAADAGQRPSFDADLRSSPSLPAVDEQTRPLTERETVKLAFGFAFLWVTANYFNSASLQHTTVASSTILSSTSTVFTLVIGAYVGVEKFTFTKLLAVLGTLAGVAIISKVDTANQEGDGGRGSFPYKSPWELAMGDIMALVPAIVYGVYSVLLAKTVGNETRINMQLFFGFIGLVGIFCLWPLFLILHFTGVETFQLPANGHIWSVVIINAVSSLIADTCWGYAVLYLSPLVVTVGLSLTIPLALLGQILVSSQWVSPLYFVGAAIVVVAFIAVNYENPPSRIQQEPTPE